MDLDNLFDRVSTDVKTNFYPSVKTIFLSNREGGEKIVFVEGSDQVWSWFQTFRGKSESGNFNLTKKLKFTS